VRWSSEIFIDGYEAQGDKVHVFLTDGTDYWLGDGHFVKWEKGMALIDGWVYRVLTTGERLAWERAKNRQEFIGEVDMKAKRGR
jgi:hypothetical protein